MSTPRHYLGSCHCVILGNRRFSTNAIHRKTKRKRAASLEMPRRRSHGAFWAPMCISRSGFREVDLLSAESIQNHSRQAFCWEPCAPQIWKRKPLAALSLMSYAGTLDCLYLHRPNRRLAPGPLQSWSRNEATLRRETRSVGAESVSINYVTGTLNRIGGHLAAAAGREPLPEPQGPGDSHLARARIDASVWSGFLIGAGLSGMAGSHFRIWALLPPCVVMIALGLFFCRCATPSRQKTITPQGSIRRD